MDGQRSTKIRRGFAPLLSASLPSPRSIRGFDAFSMLLPRYCNTRRSLTPTPSMEHRASTRQNAHQ
eukprot:4660070-Prymnesium_polylepis.1